jgi:hypothetical protein
LLNLEVQQINSMKMEIFYILLLIYCVLVDSSSAEALRIMTLNHCIVLYPRYESSYSANNHIISSAGEA